jgi:glycosyltransferase involved in cell wall biosynthesis
MFCGRPAVVTRTGGNHELLRDNEDGFVSAGEHPEVIRETLERAWSNRQRWPEMGEPLSSGPTPGYRGPIGAFI